jgi:hypothetical protein
MQHRSFVPLACAVACAAAFPAASSATVTHERSGIIRVTDPPTHDHNICGLPGIPRSAPQRAPVSVHGRLYEPSFGRERQSRPLSQLSQLAGGVGRPFEPGALQIGRELLVEGSRITRLGLERFALGLRDLVGVRGHLELRHSF